ncbi:MAG: carbohydrate ABC transporter permease [Clostridia bacterium]|nr:carbohydrate ABC transporter permease [Clostridia bacterium]
MKKLRREPIGVTVLCWTALAVMTLVMVFPLLLVLNVSLKSSTDFLKDPSGLFAFKPFKELFANYKEAFEVLDVFGRLAYTVGITVGSALISCVVIALVAFPLARGHFKGSDKVFTFILLSTFFPGSLIANIFLVQNLGLYNSPFVLVIFWGFGGLTVYIFMAIQFVKDIPRDLDEAAFIDGCGYFRYVFGFVIPLMKPILSTVFILKLVGGWNDFLTPYIYLIEDKYMTISTGLFAFKGQFSSDWTGISAATFTVALPVICLYVFLQRYIIEGMAAGALKG